MNKDKVGEPFHYLNAFLLLLGHTKVYFHLPYRQIDEGIAKGYAHGKVFLFKFIKQLKYLQAIDLLLGE